MTTLREAAQQALGALSLALSDVEWRINSPTQRFIHGAYNNLRTALAQEQAEPVQEPVAWLYEAGIERTLHWHKPPLYGTPLYTAPPRCPNCASLEAQNDELDRKLAELEQADLSRCPQCGSIADNGHDRSIPPNPYFCSKCTAELSKPLYTAPPQRQPLSGLEVERLLEQVIGSLPAARNLVRAVERAHGIIESEIKVDIHQTLDDAMQQPRAMAQAYENGYKAGQAHERERIIQFLQEMQRVVGDAHNHYGVAAVRIKERI